MFIEQSGHKRIKKYSHQYHEFNIHLTTGLYTKAFLNPITDKNVDINTQEHRKQTAHAIVSLPNPEKWLTIYTSDWMMLMR